MLDVWHRAPLFALLLGGTLCAAPSDFHFTTMAGATGIRLLGAATKQDAGVQLTPLSPNQFGALWLKERRQVSPSFETEFTFRLVRARNPFIDGSDGLAFVIQNVGPDVAGGTGSAGGFSLGRGNNPPRPGIARSLVVFLDTHRNAEEGDPSSNSIGLYTNADGNFPPRRLAIRANAPVRLNDGKAHGVRIHYERPLLEVFLDDKPVLQTAVALETIVGTEQLAYLGFTAATGDGYQRHEIHAWRFQSPMPTATSSVRFEQRTDVTSRIHFGAECMPGRTLCTPAEPEVTELAPGRWRVVLPAHLRWAAEIPNPAAKPVAIHHPQGTICWKSSEAVCHGPEGDSQGRGRVRMETRDGRTMFSIDTGANPSGNEGFFSFEAVLAQ